MVEIPQFVLDALTDVEMPRVPSARLPQSEVDIRGHRIPVYRSQAVVLGSGAAGLRAAVELRRRNVDVVVVTQLLYGGTSACSGSDKQTLHTACTGRRGDDYFRLADALSAGGAMDADTAYVEAVGSIEAMSGLQFLGLPLPEDRYGSVLRYQTDHDEAGRATSCGPRTSRLMVKVLAEEAIRLGVPIFRRSVGVKLLTSDDDKGRVTLGLLAIRENGRSDANPLGLAIFLSPAVILATGGPGELYRDSVYPTHCFGSLGLALEAGIELVNLTESQFGVGTRRDEFPWNLSGTYVQAIPYLYSVDERGIEHNFLADYYRTTQELASNIFRKGYQWPFHASRMLNHGSSLVDLAIFVESQAGRTVYMDFNRNPEPVSGDKPFCLDELDQDVRDYLTNNGALQSQPIDRLRCMNPLSIELYKRAKRDITRDPLPFNMNNQHMNGGIAVDMWGQSSLSGCYAVGEVAGTHGVTRPGGAALNAGQVFGLRSAKHISSNAAARSDSATPSYLPEVEAFVDVVAATVGRSGKLAIPDLRREIQARMSDNAGFICRAEDVAQALAEAKDLNRRIATEGIHIPDVRSLARAIQWQQMALTSEAVLLALHHFIAEGGGSRGARALCSREGTQVPMARGGALERFRFVSEQDAHKTMKIVVRMREGGLEVVQKPVRQIDRARASYFERDWVGFLTGDIYRTLE
jgi:succinate dehydrogenase/fumarate reductase flavoprotein subunit